MNQIIAIVIGAVAAALIIFFCRKNYSPDKEISFYSSGLIIAALIYVVFLINGSTFEWRLIELGGVLLFGIIAKVSREKKWASLLALGWLLHIGWDTLLHNSPSTSFVPNHYEELCIGFDLVMAGYIFFVLKNRISIGHG